MPSQTAPLRAAAPTHRQPAAVAARPTVTAIVCAFTEDRWDDLGAAVRSLQRQTERPLEIILVIDHCPALLRRARQGLTGVTVVPNRFSRGLSGGRNTGVGLAAGDVVAFLDDDAAADPQWVARLADSYTDPRVLGVGGLVRPAFDTARPGWFPAELDWVIGCSYRGLPVGSAPVRNFIGANMSFRRAALAVAGGFSDTLGRVGTVPLGCEETELCLRVSAHYPDGVLLYQPGAAVDHRVRPQRTTWRYLRSRCYAEGLSKARVATLAGAGRALASERSYLRSAIPRAVGRSLAGAARGKPGDLATAVAIVTAVAWTASGYLVGRMRGSRRTSE
jgi:glycosyltransferase involved in cell wall biosynthesis